MLRAALVCWAIAVLFVVPPQWRAVLALALAAAFLLVACLRAFDALPPEGKAR